MTGGNEFSALVGELIKRHRERVKLTQDELAQRVGLTRTSISNMEAGRQRIQLDTLHTIAEILKVSMNDLIPHSLEKKSLRCKICGLDINKIYGELSSGYIDAKHIKRRLRKISNEKEIADGFVICGTCHEILQLNPELNIGEFRMQVENKAYSKMDENIR